jgi:DNA-binding beta-propeller fold protein YncE
LVQGFLTRRTRCGLRFMLAAMLLLTVGTPARPQNSKKRPSAQNQNVPDLLLEGGRRLSYERNFSWEHEVRPKRGFWRKMVDVVAGEPQFHSLVRPYSVVTDSRGRIIVSDPGAFGVHVFDFAQQKYKFLSRREKGNESLVAPQCVAVDVQDNVYVTDSETGKIFVWDAKGNFTRTIGSLKYGEGFFKRPTGIAVDSAAGRIYVSDTLRNKIYVMDMQGSVLQMIGKPGSGEGEFNFPTELRLDGPDLLVVDAMNFRVQVLDRSGVFRYALGKIGDSTGAMFRPKGIGIDSEGDIYVVDGLWGMVQVFNRQGQLLYYFGQSGSASGQFQLPTGLFIDRDDRIYVVDSLNRRVQIFHYFGLPRQNIAGGSL